MDPKTLIEQMSQDAAAVACWALLEEKRQPRWRFLQRAWLRRVFAEHSAQSERLLKLAEHPDTDARPL